MAILSIDETFRGGRSGEIGEDYEQQYRRIWLVVVDSLTDDPNDILDGTDPNSGETIAIIGDSYPSLPAASAITAVAVHREAVQQDENPFIWMAIVQYSTITNPSAVNPLLRPPEVEWGQVSYQHPLEQANRIEPNTGQELRNKGVANSAGDKFDPPVMDDDFRSTLAITVYRLTFPRDLQRSHTGRVNADQFWGFPPGKVRCMGITGPRVHEAGRYYYKVRYEFQIREEGWDIKVLDQGSRELAADGTTKKEILDPAGSQGGQLWPLDDHGRRLSNANAADGDFVYRIFRPRPWVAFADLDLTYVD